MEAHDETIHLKGVEKAAVLFLCLPEEKGTDMMRQLSEDDRLALIKTISTLGVVPAASVEAVLREFSASVSGKAGVMGSMETARRMLAGFLPEGQVARYMDDLYEPRENRNVWEDFSALSEQVIANYLRGEHDQTVAAIIYKLSQLKPQVAAAVLPHFGPERMADIVERMMTMEALPKHMIEEIENALSSELLGSATRKSGADPHQRMADVLNKMDPVLFEQLSANMEGRGSQTFVKVKEKMFTFDDLLRLTPSNLQGIKRRCDNKTLALALKGAKQPLREMFLSPGVMTQRAREEIQEEIAGLGSIRAKEARDAQNRIIEITLELIRQDLIVMPSEDDQILD